MGLYHALDGVTNLKYKLLYFLTPNKKISKRKALAYNRDRCCHLAICLRLILFHYSFLHHSLMGGFEPFSALVSNMCCSIALTLCPVSHFIPLSVSSVHLHSEILKLMGYFEQFKFGCSEFWNFKS
jgi:hypothetical protein